MSLAAAAASPAADDRAFFGHPPGLLVLSLSEAWVGFSFYGMQALLVLYMTSQLLRPEHVGHVLGFDGFRRGLGLLYGPLSGQPLASAILGLYAALVYATPILGGLVGDRLLGRTRTIILGAALMTIGHFLMAFDASFLVALALLVVGRGFAGTIAAQVGELYAPADPRRADAYQIFELIFTVAVIAAPLVCGTLGERYAWHWGFAAAGVGMLIGLLTYLVGRRWLPSETPLRRATDRQRQRLSRSDWQRLAMLALLLPVLAVASVGNMQIFNAYLVWGQQNYALLFFGRQMPVTWLVSLDAFVSAVTSLLVILFWRWWAARGQDAHEIVKMTVGTGIAAVAPLILAAASVHAGTGHKIGLAWGLAFHVVNDIGFASVYAVGMSLYSRVAPRSLSATVVNAYALHLFLSNLLVGWLGGLLTRMPGTQFWLLHAGLIAAACLALLGFTLLFRRSLVVSQA